MQLYKNVHVHVHAYTVHCVCVDVHVHSYLLFGMFTPEDTIQTTCIIKGKYMYVHSTYHITW